MKHIKRHLKRFGIVLAWLVIWQLIALIINNQIILASPLEVLATLFVNVVTAQFWLSIGFSFIRIVGGFLVAFVLGVFVGALASRFNALGEFLDPAVQFLKSVPIVCIIVLLLIWFGSYLVSAVAVFLFAFPAIYSAVLEAFRAQNQQLAQLLKVFQVGFIRRALAFYWPTLLPFLLAASRMAVGMSWKAGVAAELIGLPLGSIGEDIYHAKLTLSSAELFAWTAVIVAISLVCEKLFLLLLRKSESWTWRAALPRAGQAAPGAGQTSSPRAGQTTPLAGLFGKPKAPSCFEQVSISFEQQAVLSKLSFTLLPGKRYALRSMSGGGKTSTLFLLAGLLTPDSGLVKTEGHIALVFQEARLFEQHSAVENVQLLAGHFASSTHIRAMLEQLLPEDSLDKPVKELSGGMRRRVELVRALLFPSQLLLLDEPFSGLDAKSKVQTQQLLLQQLQGRTLVVATHENSDAQALDLETINL